MAAKGSVSMAAALGSSASISKAASIGAKVPRARTLLFNRSIHAAAVVCSAGAESDVVELQLKVRYTWTRYLSQPGGIDLGPG